VLVRGGPRSRRPPLARPGSAGLLTGLLTDRRVRAATERDCSARSRELRPEDRGRAIGHIVVPSGARAPRVEAAGRCQRGGPRHLGMKPRSSDSEAGRRR
jgi:hypothetical protein